jgi:hypothetical protein
VTGPDGNLWFTEQGANRIGRITTSGNFTEYPLPPTSSQPTIIVVGPDGNLWFTEQSGNQIGRITPTGAIAEFPVPTASSNLIGITAGPDGDLWFAEFGGLAGTPAGKIGRLPPAFVAISPGAGALVTTQHFDLTLRLYPAGLTIVGGQLLFDGADVTAALASCLVGGARVTGGLTARCPGVSGGLLPPGFHTLSVSIALSDGSIARDTVTWQIEANHEP